MQIFEATRGKISVPALGLSKKVLCQCLGILFENDDVREEIRDSLDSFDLDLIKRAVRTMFEHRECITIRSLKKILLGALHKLKV